MPIAIGPFVDRYQDLSDVLTTSLADQDTFKWDAGSSKFVHSTFVSSFNTRTGAVTLTSGDVTTALGYTPVSAPAGSSGQIQYNDGAGAFAGSASLINAAGQIGLMGTAIDAATSATLTRSGTGNWTGLNVQLTRTDTGTFVLGLTFTGTANHTSGTLSQIQGFLGSARLINTGTLSFAQGIQGSASCSAAGAGVITLGEGVRGQAGVVSSGNLTTGIGVLGLWINSGGVVGTMNILQSRAQFVAGTITSLRGLYVGGWTGNPAATDLDGILIDSSIDAAAATNKFAIRSLSVSPSLLTGDLTVSGLLKTGSGPVTLTDAAGNLLAAALNAGYGFTLTGTAAQVYTFPTTTATLARTDAGQTFTGTNAFGVVTGTSFNGLTLTTSSGSFTLANSKVFTVSNTLTLTATDGSTLAIGTGGTLGTAAYTAASAYQPIDSDLTIVASIGSALQQLRVNAGGTAIEYFTPAAAGLTIGTTTITSGANTKVLFNNSGVVGEYTVTGSTNVVMSASPTLTGTVGLAALTATGTIVQTSNSATAFESGPNGSTNPVFRLVNSTASQAGGISITGNAAGAGGTIASIGGTNESLTINAKGAAMILTASPIQSSVSGFGAGTSGAAFQLGANGQSLGLAGTAVFLRAVTNGIIYLGEQSNTQFIFATASPASLSIIDNSAMLKLNTDSGISRNGAAQLQINTGTAGQWGSLLVGTRDAGTTTVTNGLTIGHQSTGTPAAGLGSAILFNINSSTTADQNAAQIAALWTTATHASRTSDLVFYTNNNAAGLAEAARLTGVKDFTIIGKLSTADPTSGAGPLWKLGTKKTAVAVTISPTDYVEIEIAGAIVKVGVVT